MRRGRLSLYILLKMERSTNTLKTTNVKRSDCALDVTKSDSTECSVLEYFCALSEDQEILSAKANNINHPKLSQQKKFYHDKKHCLHGDFQEEKNFDLFDYSEEVIDIALDIASIIEEKHPSIRPYISTHLIKKYFCTQINHQKFRDHSKCINH